MELNLTDKQKILLEGIIRSLIFLVVMRELALFIFEYITGPIMGVAVNCFSKIDAFLNPEPTNDGIDIFAFIIFGIVCFVFNTYVIAKLCGILKYFSKLKFWKSFLCLLLISYAYYYFSYLNLHTFKLNYDADEAGGMDIALTILPSYIIFLFFNFVTKKIPIPFKQIGYFFSKEFYIDLYKKYLKKSKNY